jgi:hypothetical protein
VALACGVIGVVPVLFTVLTGQQLDRAPSQSVVVSGLAELWYNFAGLHDAGTAGGMAEEGFVPAPEPVSGPRQRWRKRIVARVNSPRCSGLRSDDGAYFCRPRS